MDTVRKSLKTRRILYPILIGLGMATYLLYRNFKPDAFDFLVWTHEAVFFVVMAFVMMAVRDFSYIIRLRFLTDNKINWRQAFDVTMLWEFSSAISPSVVGGTGPAIFFLYKEGVTPGKSTAVILTAIFLDELFFIILVPLMFVFFGMDIFPPKLGREVAGALIIGYSLIFIYTVFLAYALFINPHMFKSFLSWIFLFPILRKWRMQARKSANQLITTSRELKGKSIAYWAKGALSTFASWTGRYWVVNFLFMAFFSQKAGVIDHLLIYGRQLTMWIILLVSPTPGGSGVAEYIFTDFLGDFIPNASWAIPLAFLWRLVSYYPYLFIGAIVLPTWLRRVYSKSKYKVIS